MASIWSLISVQPQAHLGEGEVVVAPGELAVVEQVVTPAAPERLSDPRSVETPGAAAALGAGEPPPFAAEVLGRGAEPQMEIDLGARHVDVDVGPELITDAVAGVDVF